MASSLFLQDMFLMGWRIGYKPVLGLGFSVHLQRAFGFGLDWNWWWTAG
jgi:hypothetical protein